MKICLSFLAAAFVTFMPVQAIAHSGGLDAQGCHTRKATGEYHCHNKPVAIESLGLGEMGGAVKKSKSGICHSPESRYYAQTLNFKAYPSLDDCLASGGRLPKR